MPALRIAYTITPVAGRSDEELWDAVNGNDPHTGRPLMPEIIEYLTKPLNEEEASTAPIERPRERYIGPDTPENLQAFFEANWWTDFRPIVLPTEERVAEMLAHTSHDPDEVLGTMSVTFEREQWSYTVETVAINAVMAGAPPEYFPAILALAATGTNARPSSTAAKTAMAVFNGPIVDELGLNSGVGALQTNYNRASSLISRAWALLSGNVTGGSEPGFTYLGVQGNPIASTPPVFAEIELDPDDGWKPLHVQKGFDPEDSVVSTFSGCEGQNTMMVLQPENWEWMLKKFITFGIPNRRGKTLLIPKGMDASFKNLGFDTKEELIEWVKTNCTWPKKHYWLDQEVINYQLGPALQGREPQATWYNAADDFEIPYLTNVEVVMVGEAANARWSVNECGYSKSVKIDDWR